MLRMDRPIKGGKPVHFPLPAYIGRRDNVVRSFSGMDNVVLVLGLEVGEWIWIIAIAVF